MEWEWERVYTDDYCEKERSFWEKRYGKSLSLGEVRCILVNLVHAVDLLDKWAGDAGSKVQKGVLK